MLPLEVFYLFLSKNFAASNFLYYLDNLGLLTLFFFYFSIVDSKHFHLNYQSEKFLLSAMPEYDRKKKIQEVFSLFLSENFCCWQMFFFLLWYSGIVDNKYIHWTQQKEHFCWWQCQNMREGQGINYLKKWLRMPVCCNLQLVLGRFVEMQSFNLIRIIRYSLRNKSN